MIQYDEGIAILGEQARAHQLHSVPQTRCPVVDFDGQIKENLLTGQASCYLL